MSDFENLFGMWLIGEKCFMVFKGEIRENPSRFFAVGIFENIYILEGKIYILWGKNILEYILKLSKKLSLPEYCPWCRGFRIQGGACCSTRSAGPCRFAPNQYVPWNLNVGTDLSRLQNHKSYEYSYRRFLPVFLSVAWTPLLKCEEIQRMKQFCEGTWTYYLMVDVNSPTTRALDNFDRWQVYILCNLIISPPPLLILHNIYPWSLVL